MEMRSVRRNSAAYNAPSEGDDGNAQRATEFRSVQHAIGRRRWKCAACDGIPQRATRHRKETMEMRCVRWDSAARNAPSEGDDGNAQRAMKFRSVRRAIGRRRWDSAAYDGIPLRATEFRCVRRGRDVRRPPRHRASHRESCGRLSPPLRQSGLTGHYGRGVLREVDPSTVKTAFGMIGATRKHVLRTRCIDDH